MSIYLCLDLCVHLYIGDTCTKEKSELEMLGLFFRFGLWDFHFFLFTDQIAPINSDFEGSLTDFIFTILVLVF